MKLNLKLTPTKFEGRTKDEAIENMIRMWDGTIHGQTIRNMYENGSDYESICEIAGIEYEDYEEE